MKYKKYFRKTSLKQKGVGELFLNEIALKKPKTFLEVGVFHGVTARNVCELLHNIHGKEFKYIGLDLFEENDENKDEIIPNTKFSNPLKTIFFKYIKRQNPYSLEAIYDVQKNPLGWLDTMLNAVEHMNFFEGRATEYSKASTQGTWAEAFN